MHAGAVQRENGEQLWRLDISRSSWRATLTWSDTGGAQVDPRVETLPGDPESVSVNDLDFGAATKSALIEPDTPPWPSRHAKSVLQEVQEQWADSEFEGVHR